MLADPLTYLRHRDSLLRNGMNKKWASVKQLDVALKQIINWTFRTVEQLYC